MADKSNRGSYGSIKNYALNISIILLVVITTFLLYNFYKRVTSDEVEVKPVVRDSTVQLTKQPVGNTLQIDVQNGCGTSGAAEVFTDYLRTQGFDVVEMGNFSSQDIKTSMVIDRAGNMRNAKRVAQSLGIPEKYVIQQMNKNYFLDATVVVGKDFADLVPYKLKSK